MCGPVWSYGFWGGCVERFTFGQLPLSSRSKSSSHLIFIIILKDRCSRYLSHWKMEQKEVTLRIFPKIQSQV